MKSKNTEYILDCLAEISKDVRQILKIYHNSAILVKKIENENVKKEISKNISYYLAFGLKQIYRKTEIMNISDSDFEIEDGVLKIKEE